MGWASACGVTPATYPDITPFVVADIEAPTIADAVGASGKADSTASGTQDAVADADAATSSAAGPAVCSKDDECKALTQSDCLTAYCDLPTKQCTVAAAADGKTCKVHGPCGGGGKCQAGVCQAENGCAPAACTPMAIACGAELKIDPAEMPNKFKQYACDSATWEGPDRVFSLTVTSAKLAQVTLQGGGKWKIFDLAPATADGCNPATCAMTGTTLQFGLQAATPRWLAIDSAPGATPTVISVACAASAFCGNATCESTEACWSCPADCGACDSCGDGKCEPKKLENCTSCAKDCGACKPGCPEKDTAGCTTHTCEACVCAADPFCCATKWDDLCAKACLACSQNVCGDGKCDAGESQGGCVQDCPPAAQCGDGKCVKGESCAGCPQDCGNCNVVAAKSCGDGLCKGNEHCGNCAIDCGNCGNIGCVCAKDAFCCSTAFDAQCVDTCASCAKGLCPKPTCGDGVCGGGETCSSCATDCGPCSGN